MLFLAKEPEAGGLLANLCNLLQIVFWVLAVGTKESLPSLIFISSAPAAI